MRNKGEQAMQYYEVAAAIAAVLSSLKQPVSKYHRRHEVRKYARARTARTTKTVPRFV